MAIPSAPQVVRKWAGFCSSLNPHSVENPRSPRSLNPGSLIANHVDHAINTISRLPLFCQTFKFPSLDIRQWEPRITQSGTLSGERIVVDSKPAVKISGHFMLEDRSAEKPRPGQIDPLALSLQAVDEISDQVLFRVANILSKIGVDFELNVDITFAPQQTPVLEIHVILKGALPGPYNSELGIRL
jgi:hypothetical protein